MSARDLLSGPLAEPGPWVTVLADVSRDLNDPKRTNDLRHRAILDSLLEQGATQADHDAVQQALAAEHHSPSPSARFLAVREGAVEVNQVLLTQIQGDGWGRVGNALDPLPLLARDAFDFDALLVEAERDGATIWHRRSEFSDLRETDPGERVEGATDSLHKVPGGGWSHLRYQHHTEETWKHNEKEVAQRVSELVERFHPRIIVLAGDLRAVQLVRDALPSAATELLAAEPLEASAGDDREALFQRFERLIADVAATDEYARTQRLFSRSEGESRTEALGIGEVVSALQESQAATVFVPQAAPLGDDEGERTVIALDAAPWVSTAPEQDFGAGELGTVPASVGIARAAVLTDAEVVVTASGELPDDAPAAALLRWPVGPPQPE
ncbi:Vms1/Ankzf1 family peptidyl-tRNA hydrolase [Leifsonia sp. F6_8S_P_1B]|uniref:Vms1/Ankzf1 family peptidyl-tRNA hydrolase n=1 Tax=Leifsonia williamsii TaxID=3035919 RepID=A0ABT8K7T4_9MICO|nr:Vms1/Ankzf1 family peptidyl-tRNA hydrolase [Leifsonia williamsii]MDN4613063.1 Vms1/Ankzf1 family peptidyl-tRNA hydrolase [Leifsonia williamsii]